MSQILNSWPIVSLFDFCNPKQWPTIPQTAFVEQGYPVYGANGKIGHYTDFNHEKPTVLITCRGATCGTINVCEPKSYVTGNAMALDDLDESRVSAKYLVYALRSGSLNQAISGTAQPQITRQSLTAISIPLPPLMEQRRIAEVLDRAEALRAKRRAALAQLDSFTQSLFVDAFDDPLTNPKRIKTAKLGSLCVRVTDGTHQPPKWSADGHPFLFVSNIVSGEITFDTEKFISNETHAELTRRCPIELGDVLYSTVGSYGVPAIVRSERKFAFQRHIAHLKPERTLLDSEFLAAMLASPPLKRQADRAAKGVAQKTVNLSEIREFVVFQPPLPLQREFARQVSAVEKLKAAQRASLAELDALFASLQHRAFRGEL